jgi:hypothetical protein
VQSKFDQWGRVRVERDVMCLYNYVHHKILLYMLHETGGEGGQGHDANFSMNFEPPFGLELSCVSVTVLQASPLFYDAKRGGSKTYITS